MEFRKYLRDLIASRQMTLSQIEMKSGIPSTYMSQVISGKRDIPNEITLIKLSRILGVPEKEMLERAGKVQSSLEEEFRIYLRTLIDENQLTLTQVEVRSGISNSYLSQILSGKRGIPPEETLRKLARSLGINEFEMLEKAGKLPSDFNHQVKEYIKRSHKNTMEQVEIDSKEGTREFFSIGQKIKRARIEKGYTLEDLSMTMCYPEELLEDMEAGRQNPGEGVLSSLAQALGKSPEYFQSDKTEDGYYGDEREYFEDKFLSLQMKLGKIYEVIDDNLKSSSNLFNRIKKYPVFFLGENIYPDFFDERNIQDYLFLPGNFFLDTDLIILLQQKGLEPLIYKGDRLLVHKSQSFEKEGQISFFYDSREKTYSIKRIYTGMEGKLMAGLNRDEAIINFFDERHREIKILGIVRYLIRDNFEEDISS